MLDANKREALSELLQPPQGYRLRHAVGTTFTLDLVSALAVPLSFIKGSGENPENSVAVINAVRKVSDRIDIFSQAGLTRVPRQANDLFTVLEPMLHQVVAPRAGGLFHPKIWIVEYESGDQLAYRFLCSSRNLTPDASWDLLVRLDGRLPDPEESQSVSIDNGPLSRFIQALPGMATLDLSVDRANRIAMLSQRISMVKWELPPDIQTLAFRAFGTGESVPANSLATLLGNKKHSVGLNGHSDERRAFGTAKLVISPFIDDITVSALSDRATRRVDVFGRAEEIDKLGSEIVNDPKISFHAFNEIGDVEVDEGEPSELIEDLRGLHAKAVFTDFDRTTHMLIGSANATQAAFHRNVEFCVEMTGAKSSIGVDQIRDDLNSLHFLPFEGTGGVEESSESKAEFRLQNALIEAAANVFILDASLSEGREDYEVRIEHTYSPSADFESHIGLLTLPYQLVPVRSGFRAQSQLIQGLPLAAITPFILIQLSDVESGLKRSAVAQGVLRTEIEGRIDRIIASQLDSPEKIRAFLLMFLTPENAAPHSSFGGTLGFFGTALATNDSGFAGLYEAVAATTANSGADKIFADVESVLNQLYKMSEGDPNLNEIRLLWDAALAAVEGA